MTQEEFKEMLSEFIHTHMQDLGGQEISEAEEKYGRLTLPDREYLLSEPEDRGGYRYWRSHNPDDMADVVVAKLENPSNSHRNLDSAMSTGTPKLRGVEVKDIFGDDSTLAPFVQDRIPDGRIPDAPGP